MIPPFKDKNRLYILQEFADIYLCYNIKNDNVIRAKHI